LERVAFLLAILSAGITGVTPIPTAAQITSDGRSSAVSRSLAAVLNGMDQAAPRFRSMAAKLEYTKVTVIVDDHSTERGSIYFDKQNGKTRMMIAFQDPAEKYVLFEEGKVSIYRPRIAEVQEYELSDKQGLVEEFLLLGFGTAGEELRKSYNVSLNGEEALDGQKTFHLKLDPKSQNISSRLQSIELWISPDSWQPLQQKFFEPSGDYLIARYADLKVNESIPSKNFRLPLKGKVRTVRPQKPNN